jgi:replicative DNA helicase
MALANNTDNEIRIEELRKDESERFVLGALLTHGTDLFSFVFQILPKAEMFFNYAHMQVYQAMISLVEQGKAIDLTLVAQYSSVIDYPLLGMLAADMPLGFSPNSPSGRERLESHCREITESYFRRELYKKMNAKQPFDDILQTISELERKGTDRFLTPTEVVAQLMKSVEDGPQATLKYPWPQLNKATGGIHKGQYIIVAARPGAGKTTFLENLAFSLGEKGKKVLFATAEMPAVDLAKRSIAHMTRINMFFGKEQYSQEEISRLQLAARKLEMMPIFVHEFRDTGQLDTIIRERMRDVDLVVVDYVQLLRPKYNKGKNDYERVSAVSLELVEMAKKYKIPFVCAVQLGRNAQSQQPTLADIKNSGQVEQDADVVISLWEHKDDVKNSSEQKVRMDMLKNRNGYTFGNFGDHQVFLNCDRAVFQFSDPTTQTVPQW